MSCFVRWCCPFADNVRSRHILHAGLVLGAVGLVAMSPRSHAESDAVQGRMITRRAVVVNPETHKAYAVDEGAGTVSVIDEQTGSIRTVQVGQKPIAIAINRKTNRIYVANTGSSSISVIDGSRDAVIATIHCDAEPYVLAVNEATNTVYVTNTTTNVFSDILTVINGATNTAHALKVGAADGIVIDPRNNTVFLMSYEDPNIRILDGTTGNVREFAVGPHLWGMAFDSSKNMLYLAHTGTADLVAMNEKTHAVHTIPVGTIPCAVAVDAATHRIYVVNYGDRTVSVIDAAKGTVIATLPVGKHPQAVAVDSVHHRIYVANVHSDSVTVIDGPTNKIIGTLRAGRNPYALAVDPTASRIYAANYGEPSVTAIDVAHASATK